MPLNATIGVDQTVGAWKNYAEVVLVDKKSRVDDRRDEATTAGYGLVNLGTRYQLPHGIEILAGVRNLFDKSYELPLGGANLAAFAANGGTVPSLQGQGRSLDVGVSIKF